MLALDLMIMSLYLMSTGSISMLALDLMIMSLYLMSTGSKAELQHFPLVNE